MLEESFVQLALVVIEDLATAAIPSLETDS